MSIFLTSFDEMRAQINDLKQQVETLSAANSQQGVTIGRLIRKLEERNQQYFNQVERWSKLDELATRLEYELLQARAQSAAWKQSAKLWRRGCIEFGDVWTRPVDRDYPFMADDAHHALTGE
jgi:DNA repair exonuclease SbcCD ATPase subunit